mmetsp:Transcript_25030/g.41717  ORF Transcript_25030/g.41717 Transcript_25030/m.41717 type:complete len:204 (-) Transcript_25030:126-737(-)
MILMWNILPLLAIAVVFLRIRHISAGSEHGARIEEAVTAKTKESHDVNEQAQELLLNSKTRMKQNTEAARHHASRLADGKYVHEKVQVVPPKPATAARKVLKEDENKMATALKYHGVSDGLVHEINNMASASIPREHIVKHVQTHYPNKDPHEWNDIVISAIGVTGKAQPDTLDMKKSAQQELNMNKRRFEHAKKSMNHKVEL